MADNSGIKKWRRKILGNWQRLYLKLKMMQLDAGPGFYSAGGLYINRKHKVKAGKNLFLGRHVHIASNVEFGDNVLVASFVGFVGGDHKIDGIGNTPMNQAGVDGFKTTTIKDNVWIGHGAIILNGITIEQGAVIAAGAVVTKDVEENSIVAGPYAQEIRKRNP
ncbi:MAG: hypothetical protein HKN09_13420 [Saprospiraceae bacterium]|nr:hypothetical protein [Saprospiraceae bacterium]